MPEDSERSSAQYPTREDLTERAERGDPVARLTVRARQIETGGAVAMPAVSKTERRGRRMSASLLRLAKRLGKQPDELAKGISDDTIRRSKYPVVEEPQDGGKILFKHTPVK